MPVARPHAKLGARLRELRKRTPLTLETLAVRVGVSHQYLSAVELGQYRPKPPTLRRIAQVLHDEGAPADEAELFALAGYARPVAASLTVDEAEKLPVLQRLSRLSLPILLALEEIARRVHLSPHDEDAGDC